MHEEVDASCNAQCSLYERDEREWEHISGNQGQVEQNMQNITEVGLHLQIVLSL